MSTRKRKNSALTGKKGNPSKRARLLSELWKSREKISENPEQSSSDPPSPVYRIKAIIGEKSREYLIDWADDPIAAEKFKPDWVSRETQWDECMHYMLSCS